MTGPRPVRDPLAELESRLGLGAVVASDPLDEIEARLNGPRATVTAGPVTPVGIPASEIERLNAPPAPPPRTRSTGADIGMSALRGLAEAGYSVAQGGANMLDALPGVDGLGQSVRDQRTEMRQVYGEPETGAGQAALFGAGLVGSGATFMAPGAALARGGQALQGLAAAGQLSERGRRAMQAMNWLANPLGRFGTGSATREAAARTVGGTILNTPLNLAVSQSPEDASSTFVGELAGSDKLKNAGPLGRFAFETGVDLAGNAAFEGVAKGAGAINRAMTEPSPGFITLKKPEPGPRPTMAPSVNVRPIRYRLSGQADGSELALEPYPESIKDFAEQFDETPEDMAAIVQRMRTALGDDPHGLTLRRSGGIEYRVTRDPQRPDGWRITRFDNSVPEGYVSVGSVADVAREFAIQSHSSDFQRVGTAAPPKVKSTAPPADALGGIEANLGIEPEAAAVPPPAPDVPARPEVHPNGAEATPAVDAPPAPAKSAVKPVTSLDKATTGQPLRIKAMRGEGGTRSDVPRGDLSILGSGRYTTTDAGYAELFADDDAGKVVGKVTEHDVALDNPLVISSDAEWRALTKEAGWPFAEPRPPRYMDAAEQSAFKKQLAALRKVIEGRGHDGVVIRIPKLDAGGGVMVTDERVAKTIDRLFDADQVLEFNPRTAPDAPPARDYATFARELKEASARGDNNASVALYREMDEMVRRKAAAGRDTPLVIEPAGDELFVHGTKPENLPGIEKEGRLNPDAGKRVYGDLDWHRSVSYATRPGTMWTNAASAAASRAVGYGDFVGVRLDPDARVLRVRTAEDAGALLNALGLADGREWRMKAGDVPDLPPGGDAEKVSKSYVEKLKKLGIDAIDIVGDEAAHFLGTAGDQLVILDNTKARVVGRVGPDGKPLATTPDVPRGTDEIKQEAQTGAPRGAAPPGRLRPSGTWTPELRPADGPAVKLGDGDVVRTSDGGESTPVPAFKGKPTEKQRQMQRWVLENAEAVARRNGNTFAADGFERDLEDLNKLKSGRSMPQATMEAAHDFAFGTERVTESQVIRRKGDSASPAAPPKPPKTDEQKAKALEKEFRGQSDDQLQDELARLYNEVGEHRARIAAIEESPEWEQFTSLPPEEQSGKRRITDTERADAANKGKRLGKKRKMEDLPDGGGEFDGDKIAAMRKELAQLRKREMLIQAKERRIAKLEAEAERRGGGTSSFVDDGTNTPFDDFDAEPEEGVWAMPAGKPRKPRASDPSLFEEGTTGDLFGGAPTMGESTVGMRAPKAPEATGRAPDMPGAIDADEMAARRDELGFERSGAEGTATPDQGTLFGSPARDGADEVPLSPGAPTGPLPPIAPPAKKGMTPGREVATEFMSAALGGVAGAAYADEDDKTMGAVVGALAVGGAAFAGIRGVQGALKRQAVREGVQTLRRINLDMMRGVGVSVREGRSKMLRQSALGWFNPHTEAIRVRRLNGLSTGAHEVGHFISKRLFGNPANRKVMGDLAGPKIPLTTKEKRELIEAGKRLYGDQKPAAGYGEEGLAEFAKFYVTDPARAKAEFPLTHDKLAQAMDVPIVPDGPTVKSVMDEAQRQYAKYKASSAYQRLSAMVSVNEAATVRPTIKDFRIIVENDLFAAENASREMQALGGKLKGDEIDPATMMLLSRGSAGEAARMLDNGIIINGVKRAEGISDVLKAVRDRTQDFRLYLIAKRQVADLESRGIKSGVGIKEAQETVKKFEPEFLQHAERIWAFQQAKIDMLMHAGLLTEKAARQIKTLNKHHVPFKRVFDPDELANSGAGGRAKAKNSSGIQRIFGSGREIVDPLEEIVRDTYNVTRRVREHDAARRLVELGLRTEGGSRWFERVEAPAEAQSFRFTKGTLEQLIDLGVLDEDAAEEAVSKMMTGDLSGFLSGFTDKVSAGGREAKDMVFPILNADGDRQWIQVKDPKVYEAMLGMNAEEASRLERFVADWPKWAQAPLVPFKTAARTLRAGATLTAEFIARNPVRDAMTAYVRTQAGRMVVPGEHLVRGVLGIIKQDADYDAWLRTGGAMASMVSGDRSVYQKALRDLQATATERGWYLVRHPVDFMRAVSEISENATRLGEFKLVRQRAMREGKSGRKADLLGAAAARDISVDFAKAGQGIREANKIVAFLNAYVQGNINMAKDLANRPGEVLPRIIVGITLPSLTIEALYHDDPTYQEVPEWVKRTAWVIPTGDRYIAIPKPFELGTLFGTVPQRVLAHALSKDPENLQAIKRDLVKSFTPPVVSPVLGITALTPMVENFANESQFTGRPIVPRDKEGEDPGQQSARRTGETARLVGSKIGVSPAKIENVVRGWTGGLGTTALQVPDAAIRIGRKKLGMDPLKPVRDKDRSGVFGVPGLRAFVKPAPGMDAESIERFYRESDTAERRRQTYQGKLDEGRLKDAADYKAKYKGDLFAMGAKNDEFGTGPLRERRAEMTDLRALLREVNASQKSPAEKRAATAKIEQAMIALARGGVADNRKIQTATRSQ